MTAYKVPCILGPLLEFLLLRSLVGPRPLQLEEVGSSDVHHDDVGDTARRMRMLGQRAEGAAAFIENRNIVGAKIEMTFCRKIIKYG